MDSSTIAEDRPINGPEAAIVHGLLADASVAGDLSYLRSTVADLRVVGRCPCGCPSVDFVTDARSKGSSPFADACGSVSENAVGFFLWGRDGAVSGVKPAR